MATSGGLAAEWTNRKYDPRGLWAYQPVVVPEAEHGQPGLEGSPIDQFIEASLPDGLNLADSG